MIRERPCAPVLSRDGFERPGVNWTSRVVPDFEHEKMLAQRRCDRDEQRLVCLARGQPDLVAIKIDLTQVSDARSPRRWPVYKPNLIMLVHSGSATATTERNSSLEDFAVLDRLDAFRGVLKEEAVATSATEDRADDLQVRIGGQRSALGKTRVAERRDLRAGNLFERPIRRGPKEVEKLEKGLAMGRVADCGKDEGMLLGHTETGLPSGIPRMD